MLRLVLFGFVLQQVSGVIYRLTPKEYDKLPKLSKIDEYASCMRDPGDVYCFVSARLYGNLSDPLYNTLVEYSANNITHFDHTTLFRGVCPKRSCAHHMRSTTNLTVAVEACLNETLTREYRMTAKVFEALCEEYTKESKWDGGDYAFLVAVLVLLGLNLLGSLYDFFCEHGKKRFVGRSLLCFSIRQNWRRLSAPGSSNPMHRRIKVIHCIRTLTALLVISGHSPIPSILTGNNPQFMEEMYHNVIIQILVNGTQIIQTFFLVSGLLMAYNVLLSEQKKPPSWQNLPRGVFLRWMRMTPPYAAVMFFVMTWMRHLSNGPFYLKTVTTEAVACYRDWWLHLLYIDNYKDHSQCMVHAWYVAADFQLSVVGLLIFCLLYSNRCRKMAIGGVMVLGLLTPAVHTYVQDLYAVLIVSPTVILNFFIDDPTFNNLYKRGHTNLVCYGMGMAMAYIVHNLAESDIGADRFKKYRPLYWLLFPIILATVLVGYVFYIDGMVIPVAVKVVYSSAVKLIFGFLNALFMFFTILKIDKTFRGFLHWGGWARIARVTYFAYLLHVPILRFSTGNTDELVPSNAFWLLTNYLWCTCLSFMFAVPLFLMLESPFAELVKVAFLPPPREAKPVTLEDLKNSKDTLEADIVPLFLMLESPFAELVKVAFLPPPREAKPVTLEDLKNSKDTLEADIVSLLLMLESPFSELVKVVFLPPPREAKPITLEDSKISKDTLDFKL